MTRTVHIDEGFDLLGFRIQRQPKRGPGKPTAYSYPSKKALASITSKVKTIARAEPEPAVGGPAAPARAGAAGLGELLPARDVQGHLRLWQRTSTTTS